MDGVRLYPLASANCLSDTFGQMFVSVSAVGVIPAESRNRPLSILLTPDALPMFTTRISTTVAPRESTRFCLGIRLECGPGKQRGRPTADPVRCEGDCESSNGGLVHWLFAILLLAGYAGGHGTVWADATTVLSAASFKDWKHSGSFWLLTTPEGADLPEGARVEQFPVLLRLHRDWFDFTQAHRQGDDLRVTTSTGAPLAFDIEEWDAEAGVASVWVRVPVITGNARQELRLYWGNEGAQTASDGKQVFNDSNGYLSVWHMTDPVRDEVGSLSCQDTGTTSTAGMIGAARHFANHKGVFGGENITNYPTGSNPHSTEAWFRAEAPNGRVLAWGNEHGQGKVVMHYMSPPHIKMECYFSGADVRGESSIPLGEWVQVVHTYEKGESRVYVNGTLDGTHKTDAAPLAIKSPARLFLGGWYHHYDFQGDMDEVRISREVRSADWIRLQYENQKPNQTLVGPLVQPGNDFAVSESVVTVDEGGAFTITATAGGAQKLLWILKRRGVESVVATDRFAFGFEAGRVRETESATLTLKAIFADGVKSRDIAITIRDTIPEPKFRLKAPAEWDGRAAIEVVPELGNLPALRALGADQLRVNWALDGVAASREVADRRLLLKRAQGSGVLTVTAMIDNGGTPVIESIPIVVREPQQDDPWVPRPLAEEERPEDNQFFPREGSFRDGGGEGRLVYAGQLEGRADRVFVRLYADDKLVATETAEPSAEGRYSISLPLKPGLIKYRTEFGQKVGNQEAVLHTAGNLVCGDAFVIIGQSNAVATDFGERDPLKPSDWVRTYGATAGDPNGARLKLWANAVARSPGGKSEIGYWGMELGRRLVEREQIPICLINGAVGGTRIDQHQRNPKEPTDVQTIYGRLLWRVQQAKLTHGIRAILWHQGENDQGADGPTGGYGYETYRQFFVDLAASWKEDYPNVQRYCVFQIWPKSCAMGIRGSDNRLREVQRTLPRWFSHLSVMSTLGIKPPGGCHFPAEGYAEFARLIEPVLARELYQHRFEQPVTPPNLKRARFGNAERNEVVLEFDMPVVWSDRLVSQFHLEGGVKQVVGGAAEGNLLRLKLQGPTGAKWITYLDSANWNPDNLLYGTNGLAALTFCEVPLEMEDAAR